MIFNLCKTHILRYKKSLSLWGALALMGLWISFVSFLLFRNYESIGIDEYFTRMIGEFPSQSGKMFYYGLYFILTLFMTFSPLFFAIPVGFHVCDFYRNRGYVNLNLIVRHKYTYFISDALILIIYSSFLTLIVGGMFYWEKERGSSIVKLVNPVDIALTFILFFLFTFRQFLIPLALGYILRKKIFVAGAYFLFLFLEVIIPERFFFLKSFSTNITFFDYTMFSSEYEYNRWLTMIFILVDILILAGLSIAAAYRKTED